MTLLPRLFRHFTMTRARLRRTFPPHTLQAIEAAVSTAEKNHGGEIRFAVESELGTLYLLQGLTPRERAIQVFSQLKVWDTEQNNGVLIYVLLADHDVEIVADRGYTGKVSEAAWAEVCAAIEKAFKAGEFERGVLDGIAATSRLIARHYPTPDGNELSNRTAVLD
jgi:uncharacterized membrane protein